MSERISTTTIKEILLPVFKKQKGSLMFAYLFGSTVSDDDTPLSDIDIAVFLGNDQKDSYSGIKLSLHADFCRALKNDNVDIVVLNTARNIILLDRIVRDGIVLFDTDTDVRKEYEQKILHRAIDFKDHRMVIMGV